MRTVKGTWRTYGKVLTIVGASFFTGSLIFLWLWFNFKDSGLDIWSLVLGINGAVWIVLGMIFSSYAKRESNKHEKLKGEGLRYDAKIERIVGNNYWIRIGSYRSCYAECSYQNQAGELCLVKSGSFLPEEPAADYHATIYVNRENPAQYSVELSSATKTCDRFIHDYR